MHLEYFYVFRLLPFLQVPASSTYLSAVLQIQVFPLSHTSFPDSQSLLPPTVQFVPMAPSVI